MTAKFGIVVLLLTLAVAANFASPRVSLHPRLIASILRPDSDVANLYDSKCAKCHGKDGRAKSMAGKMKHARDFTDAKWQADTSDERIINSITNGKDKMPGFGKKLSESEISVRQFRGSSGK